MRFFLLCFFVVGSRLVSGQDTISTSSSDTQDFSESRRQKFIDRYENVFMTKVPTRHLIKVGVISYLAAQQSGTNEMGLIENSLSLGYEFKLSPSFSVGSIFFGQAGLSGGGGRGVRFSGSLSALGQFRWYYDMKKRMAEGVSANNFSGNYFGLAYEYHYRTTPFYQVSYTDGGLNYGGRKGAAVYRETRPRIGLEYGIQRRFFNSGYADLAVGIYRNLAGKEGVSRANGEEGDLTERPAFSQTNESAWSIGSRASIGLAFGDWKKKSNLPYCEVLRCDEEVKSQFTVTWPHLSVGIYQQILSGGIGYEQKLVRSLSVKLQGYAFLNSLARDTGPRTTNWELTSVLQLRYYFLQWKARRKGTGGHDLNGFYAGNSLEYSVMNGSVRHLGQGSAQRSEVLKVNLTGGYQHTLFRNVYVDLNASLPVHIRRWGEHVTIPFCSFRIGFGLRF